MKKLVINADDLGICESANRAIFRCYQDGILTSASLMAIGAAFEHAVDSIEHSGAGLGVGLHLSLTSGRCLAPREEIPLLADEKSRLRNGFVGLCRLSRNQTGLAQIEKELDFQFRRVIEAGVTLDHVNSHRHVHMIPPIFATVAKLANRYDCPSIRIASEPFCGRLSLFSLSQISGTMTNLPKQAILGSFARRTRRFTNSINTLERTFGILGSGRVTQAAITSIIDRLPEGTSELLTHPGESANPLDEDMDIGDRNFWASNQRLQEADALLDVSLKNHLDAANVQLTTFADSRRKTGSKVPNSIE